MGIQLSTIDFIFDKKNLVNKNIIFIGDHRISFNEFPKNLVKKFNLDSSINLEIKEAKKNGIQQKKFLKKIFEKFGFKKLLYLDNFESQNIDFKIDLSQKNSTEIINEKFGIVVDNGTSIYSGNVINSINNVMHLVDIEGYFLTNLDPMSFNRFPMQPSPESFLDILVCNGFEANIFLENPNRLRLEKKKKI